MDRREAEMKYRKKLFLSGNIYDLPPTDGLFVRAMKENISYHIQNCPEYKDVLAGFNFDVHSLSGIDGLRGIPALPTSYLKNNTMLSKPYSKLLIKTTSSGTGGVKTLSGFDAGSAFCGLFMLLRIFRFHKMLSIRPTNYIILGYQPSKANQSATAKAFRGVTWLALPGKIEYALKFVDGEYKIDTEGVVQALKKFARQHKPVRIIGFPSYVKALLDELNKRNIRLSLHKNSKILIGGGWKTLLSEKVSRAELCQTANQMLGIRPENFKDHFSSAEHPINYIACKNGHFHVPIYSRVIIRDVNTLEPAPNGVPGLLNLISPLLSSAPYNSILTDDIAIMHDGDKCGCGAASPYFDLVGRVGLASVKTCAQAASEYLDKIQ